MAVPLRDFFDLVYSYLKKNYRNEYIYKNAIAQKIILGTHSLYTSTMLTELRAGTCKADVVVLNGTSTVYEIKSDLDSFARLAKQIDSYQQVFDRVTIITSERHVGNLKNMLPSSIGIDVLTQRYQIHTERKPASCPERINQAMIFETLRRSEYLEILGKHYGEIPRVSNTRIHSVCKDLFLKLPADTAHAEMVRVLKKRTNMQFLSDYISKLPASLMASAFSTDFSPQQAQKFVKLLNLETSRVLV